MNIFQKRTLCLGNIDKFLIINLKHRTDRLNHVKQ